MSTLQSLEDEGESFVDAGLGKLDELTTTTSVADWDTAILLAELGLGHAIVPDMPGRPYAGHSALRLIPIPMLPPLTAGWAAL